MNIGLMRDRITIQRKVATPDGIGGTTTAWSDLTTVWAAVTSKMVSEGMVEGRKTARSICIFKIYTIDGLSEIDRIVWKGVVWNIRGIVPDYKTRATVEVSAERGVA